MKKTDYIVIQAHMVTDLKLSGNRLIVYALIHGYCKDNIHEFKGSINYICEWTNLTRNTVISTLKSLSDDGLIVKREYEENHVSFCAYSLGSAKIAPNNVVDISTTNKEEEKNRENISIVSDEDAFIDSIYAMYPSKCPVRGTSLSKTHADKKRIKALMRTYTREQIRAVVEREVSNKLGKYSMKNFSTFLNNFPDPNEMCDNSTPQNTNNNLPVGFILKGDRHKKHKSGINW